MKLLVIRHGQTDWNLNKKIQGSTDIPLNDFGISQAYEAKRNVNNKNYELIICSPLTRARQTAKIVNQDKNVKVIYDNRLEERKYGILEGISVDKINFDEFFNYNQNKTCQLRRKYKDIL